jgi:O-antigen ligase
MNFSLNTEKDSKFFLIVWWILSIGLIFASRFWALNQIILKIIIPLLFLICIFKSGFSERFKNRGFALYVTFFVWACFSVFYTVNMPSTMNYLQGVLGNVIIWFITATVVIHAKDIISYLIPLLLAFLLHAYFGMVIEPETISDRVIGRASGLTANPNQLGFLMWYGIVVATFMIMISRRMFFKILLTLAIVFFIFILFKSGSRKSLAATVVFLAFSGFLFMKKRHMGLMILVVLAGFASFNFIYDYVMENTTVGARLSGESLEGGTAIRVELINDGINMFLRSPVVGVALGSFSSYSTSGMVAHNDYVEILASLGILGFIIYMSIYVDYGRKWYYLYRNEVLPNFLIIALGFIVGMLVLGTGRPSFADPNAMMLLALFHGFLTRAYDETVELANSDVYPGEEQMTINA